MKDSPQIADAHDLSQSRPPEDNWFAAIRAVTVFQLNRLLTKPRIAMGLVGALFPSFLRPGVEGRRVPGREKSLKFVKFPAQQTSSYFGIKPLEGPPFGNTKDFRILFLHLSSLKAASRLRRRSLFCLKPEA